MSKVTLERPAAATSNQPPSARPVQRRRPRQFSVVDLVVLLGSAMSAVSFVWVVFYQLTLLAGAAGFVICSFG